jgi:hypothetical protein
MVVPVRSPVLLLPPPVLLLPSSLLGKSLHVLCVLYCGRYAPISEDLIKVFVAEDILIGLIR